MGSVNKITNDYNGRLNMAGQGPNMMKPC